MIKVYTLEQSEEWDEVVSSFKEYDVYWLSGYVKAFHIHGDGEPLLIYYEDEMTRGVNVVMKRDVSLDKCFIGKIEENIYFDFTTPYGYGGWLIEGNNTEKLFESYDEWLKKSDIICEFVRFHPVIGNHELCEEFYDVVRLGEVVHMELTSQNDIWSNITSKNRNMIRKALKNDVQIYNGRFPEIFEKFREIYNGTMDKDDAEDYYYFDKQFYDSILYDLPNNAQVFWAEKDGIVIAVSVMLATNRRMNYHLSGSLKEYGSLAPTNLLLYKAALWGCANGYKTLYLGGGLGSGEDSLFKFKKAFFKGDLKRFYIGKKIYDHEKYESLCKMRGTIYSEYFPLYRA